MKRSRISEARAFSETNENLSDFYLDCIEEIERLGEGPAAYKKALKIVHRFIIHSGFLIERDYVSRVSAAMPDYWERVIHLENTSNAMQKSLYKYARGCQEEQTNENRHSI